MATYFHHGNSEIQGADGLHTLYLMNPNYAPTTVPYSEHHHHQQQQSVAPTMIMNPVATAYNPTHHFVVGTNNASEVGSSRHTLQEITAFHGIPQPHNHFHYNIMDQITNSHQHQLQLQQQQQQQGLCLSLSSQQYNTGGGGATNYQEVPTVAISPSSSTGDHHHQVIRAGAFLGNNSYSSVSAISNNGNSNSNNNIVGVRSVGFGSKYLKAAQELLDEVVNVGKGIIKASTATNLSSDQGNKEKMKLEMETVITPVATVGIGGSSSTTGGESNSTCNKHGVELTTAQRQELHMKKSKLISMLDEVEQRYRQYHEQMQIVISTFEQVVGFGSAKTYTALALQTISKQFRCLKDAISAQIKATSKSIGEEDCNNIGVKIEGSRLKYVDHQLRQQRAMQQLGVFQNNAWRPQRGLPERAVSVLRAWLFEHFLHPYPKDSDKVMLAKQTGLTRSQVSNWFINARVRLWKPMVEEMYTEELKEQESEGQGQNGNLQDNNTSKSIEAADKESPVTTVSTNPQDHQTMMRSFDQIKALQSNNPEKFSPTHHMSISPNMGLGSLQIQLPCFNLIGSSSSDMAITSSEIPKRPKTFHLHNSPTTTTTTTRDYQASAFGAYPIVDQTNQFAPSFHGNAVSLTLGLPHCDNNNQLSLSGSQRNYLSNHNVPIVGHQESSIDEFCAMRPQQTSHSNADTVYENLDMQSRSSKREDRFVTKLRSDGPSRFWALGDMIYSSCICIYTVLGI